MVCTNRVWASRRLYNPRSEKYAFGQRLVRVIVGVALITLEQHAQSLADHVVIHIEGIPEAVSKEVEPAAHGAT